MNNDMGVGSGFIRSAVESSFVMDLIYGNIVSEAIIRSYLNALALERCPNTVFIVNIDDLNTRTSTDEKNYRFERVSIMKTIRQITSLKSAVSYMDGKGDAIVLVYIDEGTEPVKLGEVILNLFNDETGLCATIGIGQTCENFIQMPSSYENAKKALKNKFFLGSHKAIHIDDIKKIDENVLECFLEKESALTKKVRIGDEEGALIILKELLSDIFKQDGVYPDMLKVRILELLTVISRAAIEGGANSKAILELKVRFGDEIAGIEDRDKFEEWINKSFKEVISYVKVNQIVEAVKATRLAQNYIDEKFEEQITLEEVAGYVHLSPYYLSHVFKKEVGKTFVEYLTEKRIKVAQQYLMTTDLSVSNIAKSVGYPDSNYFGKVFKSITGMTPGECRKKGIE